MAYIRPLKNNRFRADIRMKGVIINKTFPTQEQALHWSQTMEQNIQTIVAMDTQTLRTLTDETIVNLGGEGLFSKLGIDLFTIRHQTRLEAIQALTKKQLLQLSPWEIEQMGGVELFIQAGKRIRYKTFRDICTEYLAHWTKKDYAGQMQRVNYWCQVFGDRIMTDIDIFDLREQIDQMQAEGQRATTINRKKAVLSSVFKFALSRGYIDENIVRNVVVDDDTKRRDRVLSEAERLRLLQACRESHWDKLYLLVLMAMVTGARKGELLGLRWNAIDFKQRSCFLGNTKNGENRTIHFPELLIPELRRFQEVGNGLVFPSEQKPDQPMDIRKAWAKALKIAKISDRDIYYPDGSLKQEKFTFHCLRHGFCSALSEQGQGIQQIAEMAGHKSLQTTMRYIHQGHEQKRQIVDELTQAFNL